MTQIIKDVQRLRSYQLELWRAREAGTRKFISVWHRRAGKDRTWMTIASYEMFKRKGVYFHFLPTLGQARRSVWDNIIHDWYDGQEHTYRMIDAAFPPETRLGKPNETEMQLTNSIGSIYQLMGAENQDAIDRARGSNPIGIILSEHAFMAYDPWPVLAPVLAENNGWVAFISTPNVEDDNFHKIYKAALADPSWFVQLKTIEDTRQDAAGENGAPVISLTDVKSMRTGNITEEEIQREYYCSFKGYTHGTIYGDVIGQAELTKRVGKFPYIPQLPVGVCIDLGHSDTMAVWFYQKRNDGIVFIDYWEAVQKDIKDVAHLMREGRRYQYGRVVLPWDGRSAANYMEEVGFTNVEVCKRNRMAATGDETASVRGQLDEVRLNFSKFYFDDTIMDQHSGAGVGLDHLRKYARKRDPVTNEFSKDPKHDEHSHAADALRTGVAGGFDPLVFFGGWAMTQDIKVETAFDLEKF